LLKAENDLKFNDFFAAHAAQSQNGEPAMSKTPLLVCSGPPGERPA
jgi:hypothetical protein